MVILRLLKLLEGIVGGSFVAKHVSIVGFCCEPALSLDAAETRKEVGRVSVNAFESFLSIYYENPVNVYACDDKE